MKNIALVAHDNKKKDLIEWCDFNKGTLSHYNLHATGGTGKKIIEKTSLEIKLLKDGAHGGDIEIVAMISVGFLSLQSAVSNATPRKVSLVCLTLVSE
jgi:methylglyoxal synthase